ncbi:murein transglycosylase A [Aquicella siphonis]|nr:MltA domain-containing protein [Aquicella siphonis]
MKFSIYSSRIRQMIIFVLSAIVLPCGMAYGSAASGSGMTLSKTTFARLPGWERDNQAEALLAFRQSCAEIVNRNPESYKAALQEHVSTQTWQAVCKAAAALHQADNRTAREFFESWFVPFHVRDREDSTGLFTGYYMPVIHARLQADKRYTVPVHALPDDWVKIDLGAFYPDMAGKTLVGQVKDHLLYPYPERRAIIKGALAGKARVLAWADNPVDVYFAQVQGSSLVELPDRQRFIIGYAGDNGHRYTSIGKILIAKREISREAVSMQSIRAWIMRHPDQAENLMNQNASYVFFKKLDYSQPLGTEKIPLTPRRSLAVDQRYLPLGAPVWLSTSVPAYDGKHASKPFQRLLVTQDTGGAIKGIVRGDVYWGSGDQAAYIAGHMNSPGQYWILLPRTQA